MKRLMIASILLVLVSGTVAVAQDSPLAWAVRFESEYRIVPNITYLTASNYDAKLDLYVTRTPDKPLPTLIWIHGGGWTQGDKAQGPIDRILADGFAAASINYRFSTEATFPAQIHDCKAAVRFLRANSKE